MEAKNNINLENLNLVVNKIKEGLSGNSIAKNYGINNYEIRKILDYLKETDPKLYEELEQKKLENSKKSIIEGGKKTKTTHGSLKIVKTNKTYFNPERSIIKKYNSATIDEIILMALTFRPSVENLAKILKTTPEDIFYIFNTHDKYRSACFHLYFETRNLKVTDEKTDLITFTNALDYWVARTRLVNLLAKYSDSKNVAIIKNRLKSLHQEVDDTIFNEAKGKHFNNLSEEEARAVAHFRVKYNLSWKMIDNLGIDRSKILLWEQKLYSEDPIFANQLNFLNDANHRQKNINIYANYSNNFYGNKR